MNWLREITRRLRMLLWRDSFNADLDAEMRLHIALRAEQNAARGIAPDAARLAAQRRFGNPTLLREQSRDAWGWRWLENFLQDVRYGARFLAKSPGFTAGALLLLALGIGANTAAFTVVDAVLLRPLPFAHPERLLRVGLQGSGDPDQIDVLGDADFAAIRDRQSSFENFAAFVVGGGAFAFSGRGEPLRVRGVDVTASFFDVLGVRAEYGRTFLQEDDRPAAAPVVVVSHDFWQTQLNADPAAVGQSITLNGRAFTVVGVLARAVRFPSDTPLDVWPLRRIATPRARPPYYLMGIARLKPGVTRAQAEAELNSIANAVHQQFPNSPGPRARAVPLKETMIAPVRTLLWVLFGAVAFILLIAMVNVANLLLARGAAREREIAVRLAVGATRGRIVRQLLTESLVLSALGALAGVLLAKWAVSAFVTFAPRIVPRTSEVTVDARILLFTTALALVTGLLFGLAPALQSGRGGLHAKLQSGARTAGSGASRALRRALVAGEFALALILIVGAVLMIRSFVRLQEVNPGFDSSHILTARVSLPPALYQQPTQITGFWDQLIQRLNAVPGVDSAAVTLSLPPNLLYLTNPFTVEGQGFDPARPLQLAEEMTVSPEYFHTLGLPLIAGRTFTGADRHGAQRPIIINQTLAARWFPGQDPVGKRLQTGDPDPASPWETVIGVVGDVKYSGLDSAPAPQLYVPYTAGDWAFFSRSMYVVMRAKQDPAMLASALRDQVHALDPNLPVADVATMEKRLGDSVEQERFRTVVLGSFAALALLLACFGMYAVVSYFVSQRTREIGIRVTLGATRADILAVVLREAGAMCALGLLIGIAGAAALTRALKSLLFSVGAGDPLSFTVTVILLAAFALLATYIPARRATKIEPMQALRYE